MNKIPIRIENQDGEIIRTGEWNTVNPFLTIGRSPSCHIQLEDQQIHPLHYRLKRLGDSIFVISMYASHGGRRGNNGFRRKIHLGDTIQAGPYKIIVGESTEENRTIGDSSGNVLQFLRNYWKEITFYAASILLHLLILNIVIFESTEKQRESIEAMLDIPQSVLNSEDENADTAGEDASEEEEQDRPDQVDQKENEKEEEKPDQNQPHEQPDSPKTDQNSKGKDTIGIRGEGGPKSSGRGTSGTGNIFGKGGGGQAKWIIFVIDKSGSMDNKTNIRNGKLTGALPRNPSRLDVVKYELKEFIDKLEPDQKFNVIFFSKTMNTWRPGELVNATPENRQDVERFIDHQRADGGTYMYQALDRAFQLMEAKTPSSTEEGRAIYFLSDGRPSKYDPADIKELVQERTSEKRYTVNVTGIDSQLRTFMKNIADATDGKFKNYGGKGKKAARRHLAELAQKINNGKISLNRALEILEEIQKRQPFTSKEVAHWLKRVFKNSLPGSIGNPSSETFLNLLLSAPYRDHINVARRKGQYINARIKKLITANPPRISRIEKLLDRYVTDPKQFSDAAELLLIWARDFRDNGGKDKERKILNLIVRVFKNTTQASRAKSRLDRLEHQTAFRQYQMARNYKMNKMYEEAMKLYRKIINGNGPDRLKKKAQKHLKEIKKKLEGAEE